MKSIEKNTLLIIGIIFVAFNLRPAITSVGPLVSFIRSDLEISNGMAGLLTTLPLLAFAFISPFAPNIARKFGYELSVLIGLSILGAGIVIRSTGSLMLLFSGTILIGLGVALCNVLLPGIVKRNFPGKLGFMTGIYTLSMAVWAGLAPGLSVPLAQSLHLGWKLSLGIWLVLILLAIFFWSPQVKGKTRPSNQYKAKSATSPIWFSPIAWQVTIFMGMQSMVYFSMTAWLPEILHSKGLNIVMSGWLVTLMQFSGLPANFYIPVLADRMENQKGIALGIGLFSLAGLTGLLFGKNVPILVLSIIFIGIALGAAISHALTLIGLRAANADQASSLSGMAQSIGYLVAAIGPILIGILFDILHTWTIPLVMLIVVTILFTLAGFAAGRNQYVFAQVKSQKQAPLI
jgi:CP family cyanate transporter-like MFS transporter